MELLENDLVQPEDRPRFLGRIHQEAQRLVSLINDILGLSQLDEGAAMPRESELTRQVDEIVQDYIRGVALRLKEPATTRR